MTYAIENPFGTVADHVNVTYDAEVGNRVKVTMPTGLTYEVTDHGAGHEGDVVVPRGREQVFAGRIAGVFDFTLSPAAPTESADVAKPDASVALFAGSGTVDDNPTPGVYRETATAPNGDTFEHQVAGAAPVELAYGHASEASGTWEFEHVAGGVGVAATEIVSYEQLHVTLGGNATAS
jgi:hypothetical protein